MGTKPARLEKKQNALTTHLRGRASWSRSSKPRRPGRHSWASERRICRPGRFEGGSRRICFTVALPAAALMDMDSVYDRFTGGRAMGH